MGQVAVERGRQMGKVYGKGRKREKSCGAWEIAQVESKTFALMQFATVLPQMENFLLGLLAG